MPRQELIAVALAAALTHAVACSDAVAPKPVSSAGPPVTPSTPSTPQTPAQTGFDAIWMNFEGPGLIAGDSLVAQGSVHRGTADAPDTLAFETSDASIVSIQAAGKNRVLIRALRSGKVTISARTQSAMPQLSHQFSLQVFARSTSASPIVVDSFSILQTRMGDGSLYDEPSLRLRDTSAAGTARVIGIAIDVPTTGEAVYCAADRVVGAAGWSAFNPPGDMDYGFVLGPQGPPGAGLPTVRVSVVLSDGLGVSFTATGQMEGAPTWEWHEGDDPGVSCQR